MLVRKEVDDQDWQAEQDVCRHEDVEVDAGLAGSHAGDANRQGAHGVVGGEHKGPEVVVPRGDEGQERAGHKPWGEKA